MWAVILRDCSPWPGGNAVPLNYPRSKSRGDKAGCVVAALLLRELHRGAGDRRHVLPMWPDKSVTHVPGCAVESFGKPIAIRSGNGPELTGRAFDAWCYARGIEHHFIRPGMPVENAYAETFRSRLRDELLNLA